MTYMKRYVNDVLMNEYEGRIHKRTFCIKIRYD